MSHTISMCPGVPAISVVAGRTVLCTQPRRRSFSFDAVMGEHATQQQIFDSAISYLMCLCWCSCMQDSLEMQQ